MVAPLFSSFHHSDIDAQKRVLRATLRQKRIQPTPRESRCIRSHLLSLVRASGMRSVAAVWPLPYEVDLRPFCRWLYHAGYSVLLPETVPRGQKLLFRHWSPCTPFRKGRFGTVYPVGPYAKPEVILVPLLAFDHHGGRLGYGGGYYDRTLQAWPSALRIGYALSHQEYEHVPMDIYDQRLGIIVTERGVLRCSLLIDNEKDCL